jgi:hypothetical protein
MNGMHSWGFCAFFGLFFLNICSAKQYTYLRKRKEDKAAKSAVFRGAERGTEMQLIGFVRSGTTG